MYFSVLLLLVVLGLASLSALALVIYVIKVVCFEKTYASIASVPFLHTSQPLISDSHQPNYFTSNTNISNNTQQSVFYQDKDYPSDMSYDQPATQEAAIINAQGIITAESNVLPPQILSKQVTPMEIPTTLVSAAPMVIPSPIVPLPTTSISYQTPEGSILTPIARRLSSQPPSAIDSSMMTPTPPTNFSNSFQPLLSTASSFTPAHPTPPPSTWVTVYPTGTLFKGDVPTNTVPRPTTPPAGFDSIPHPTTPPPEPTSTSVGGSTEPIVFRSPAVISIPLDSPASSPSPTISATPPTTSTPTPPPRMPRPTTPPADSADVTPRPTIPPPNSPGSYVAATCHSPTSSLTINPDEPASPEPNNPPSTSPTNHVDVRSTFQRFPSYTEMQLPRLPDPTPSPVPIASLQGDDALCSVSWQYYSYFYLILILT